MGIVSKIFLHFPYLWVYFFVKIHSLVSCSDVSASMGMIFRKFSGFMVIHLRNFSGFMDDAFTI